MPYYLSQAQFDLVDTTFSSASEATRRAERYDLINQIIQSPDHFGTVAEGSVIAWFGAAALLYEYCLGFDLGQKLARELRRFPEIFR